MGRSPCCEKVGLKKGPWTPEEDQKLLAYIDQHGHGSWRALPAKAGLQRCGKSCRLRWTNYLRPDIKRGKFSLQEEQTIIQLHALLGNRWSAIATHLPKRTDNEIKNYWNTHLKKRLDKMGIDPVTHKPKTDTLRSVDGQSKSAVANLSHMAQWESARLEAEARLVREAKLRSTPVQPQLGSSVSASAQLLNKIAAPWAQPLCLDVLKASEGIRSKSTKCDVVVGGGGGGNDLESSSSTLSFSEIGFGENLTATNDFFSNSDVCGEDMIKEEGEGDWNGFGKSTYLMEFKDKIEDSMTLTNNINDVVFPADDTWTLDLLKSGDGHEPITKFVEGFTDLLLDNSEDRNSSNGGGDSENGDHPTGSDEYEEHKNYWNNILNFVNSSPSDSPVF